MRVLITRPEREAAALAEALGARGHQPVVAPLFRRTLPPPRASPPSSPRRRPCC